MINYQLIKDFEGPHKHVLLSILNNPVWLTVIDLHVRNLRQQIDNINTRDTDRHIAGQFIKLQDELHLWLSMATIRKQLTEDLTDGTIQQTTNAAS